MGVLDGKAAIVTGSARGIGRATAELLAEQGARVLINDLDADVAEQAAGEIGGETAVFGGDLTKEGVPDQLVQKAMDEFGQLDIVVNNAGYTWDGPIHKMSDEQFQAMLDIHTVVPFRVLRAAAPHMREPAKREAAEGVEVFRKVVKITSLAGSGEEIVRGDTKIPLGVSEKARQSLATMIPLGRGAAPEEAARGVY